MFSFVGQEGRCGAQAGTLARLSGSLTHYMHKENTIVSGGAILLGLLTTLY